MQHSCDEPSIRQISHFSYRLSELVEGKARARRLPGLSPTCVSDFLSGNRGGRPKLTRILSFVLACRYYAWDSGPLHAKPDPAAERDIWREKLETLFQDSPSAVAEPTISPLVTSAENLRQVSALPSTATAPTTSAGRLSVGEFNIHQRQYQEWYGLHGLDLAQAARAGEANAAFRLGVLLTLDRHPRMARLWLASATRSAHPHAGSLLHTEINGAAGRTAAADHAYLLGQSAHGQGDIPTAAIYYGRAAANGHADAAYHMALLHLVRGETGPAGRWFAAASRNGHPDGDRQLNQIMQGLSRNDSAAFSDT
ncbi:hypothetical protein SAMN05216275_11579 [Streptosporangium canum]|uniref:Sel1 repeat-containing protein n=1 Tax=Streptosporangium canum TaxID=324952 RepID=A0A1I3VZ76_9ACTN|nr:hypothetical protein SAMN05216275_11579 [Streptosporangium canum]